METKLAAQPDGARLLEARGRVIEKLSDGFSHDARNPLNAVVIHLEVLADKLRRENAGAVPHGLERNLKAIRDQVGRIDELVRRFVELAAPHRQLEPDFDLTALVRSVVEQCTHAVRLARADIRAEGPPGLRVPGSASELGVALALFLLAELEGGTKRLAIHIEATGGSAVLDIDGASGANRPELDGLRGAVERGGGTLRSGSGRVELSLAMARPELAASNLEPRPGGEPTG